MLHLLMSIQLLWIKAETLTTQGIIDKKKHMPMCFCIYVILFIINFPYSILRKGIIIVQFSLIFESAASPSVPFTNQEMPSKFTLLPLNGREIKLIPLHYTSSFVFSLAENNYSFDS